MGCIWGFVEFGHLKLIISVPSPNLINTLSFLSFYIYSILWKVFAVTFYPFSAFPAMGVDVGIPNFLFPDFVSIVLTS